MRRGIQTGAAVAAVFALATCGREPSPTGGPGESASVTIDRGGGRVEFGGLTLEVPAGALPDATTITVRQLDRAPWGTIGGAYDFGPDGLRFAVPARLTVDFAEDELPAGVLAESLALNVIEDGRWMPLDGGEVDVEAGTVSAQVSHFSTFGIVADPTADAGAGTRWEANGVVAESSADVVARLWVSSDMVTLLVDGQGTTAADVTFSGLPTDAPVHVYVDSVEDERMLEPSDGGTMTLHLELDRPRFIWLQFHHSTTGIGGPNDMCTNAGVDGVRVGNTCTLTHDLVGTVEIGGDDQLLDCAGYRIAADAAAVGEGFGIRVVGWHGVEVRNCTVGGPGAGFSIGLGAELSGWPADGAGLTVTACTFEDNYTGVRLEQVRAADVRDSAVLRSWRGVEVASKSEAVVFERVQIEPPTVAAEKAVGFATEGLLGKENIYYIPQGCSFVNGSVDGVGAGVALGMSREIEVRDTDFTTVRIGLLIRAAAMAGTDPTAPPEWTHRFWHNNVAATAVGVSSFAGPIEVSWLSQGSFWNHACPGPLFEPGVDSDRSDVVDSFPYGAPDAWTAGGGPGCTGDADGDTVPDAMDNCPTVPNPGQENVDGVGEGDACDVTAPEAPIIASPSAWSALPTGSITITGTAERRSAVELSDFLDVLGETRADDAGVFAFVTSPPLADDVAELTAAAVDAAGNRSDSSVAVPILVDTTPPAAPAILSPRAGEILAADVFSISGQAEPASIVSVYDGGLMLGNATASSNGGFRFVPAGSFANGGHVLTAAATDAAGWTSVGSAPVGIQVLAVTVASAVTSDRGKVNLTALADSPDPLFASLRQSSTLDLGLSVRGVEGLGGGSPNHEFQSWLTWTIKDAATETVVRNVEGVVLVPSGSPEVAITMQAAWDGRNDADEPVAENQLYTYDIQVQLIRKWIGPGVGPRCSRGEVVTTDGAGARACLVDKLTLANAGTIYVQRDSFRSDSGQVAAAVAQLEADHEAAATAAAGGMSAADRLAIRAALARVGEAYLRVGFRMSKDGTVRDTYAPWMAIPLGLPTGTPDDALAWTAVVKYRHLFGLDDVYGSLVLDEVRELGGGRRQARFSQIVRGLPVFGAALNVSLAAGGELAGFTALTVPVDRIDAVAPSVSETTAVGIATGRLPPEVGIFRVESTLGILANEAVKRGGGGSLAWRIRLFTDDPAGSTLSFVSAVDGRLLANGPFGVAFAEDRNVTFCADPASPCRRRAVPPDPTGPPEDLFGGLAVVTHNIHDPSAGWPGDSTPAAAGAAAAYHLYADVLGWDYWFPISFTPDIDVYTDVVPDLLPGGRPNGVWQCVGVTRPHVRVHRNFGCPEVVAHEIGHGVQQTAGYAAPEDTLLHERGEVNEATSDVLGELAIGISPPYSDATRPPLADAFDWVMGGTPGGVPEWGCPEAIRDIHYAPNDQMCGAAGRYPDTWSQYEFMLNGAGMLPHYNSTILSTVGCMLGWPADDAAGAPCHGARHQVETEPVGMETTARLWHDTVRSVDADATTFHVFRDMLLWTTWTAAWLADRDTWLTTFDRVEHAADAVGLFRPEFSRRFDAGSGVAVASHDTPDGPLTIGFYTAPRGAFPSVVQGRVRSVSDPGTISEGEVWAGPMELDIGEGTPAATYALDRYWVFYKTGGVLTRSCCGLRYSTIDLAAGGPQPGHTIPGTGYGDCDAVAAVAYQGAVHAFYRGCGSGPQPIYQVACTAEGECIGPRLVVPDGAVEPLTSKFGPAAAVLPDGFGRDRLWLVFGDGADDDVLSSAAYFTWPGDPFGGPWSLPDVVGPEREARETDGTDGCMRRALLERLVTLDSPSATTFRGRIHVAVRAWDPDCCGDAPPAGIIYASTANPFERTAWTRVVFQDDWGASRDAPVRLFAREPIAGEPDSGYLDAFYLETRPGRVRSVRKWSE